MPATFRQSPGASPRPSESQILTKRVQTMFQHAYAVHYLD